VSANQLTIIAAGTILRGDLFSQDLLVVEGGVQGSVVADRVIIKDNGWVKGNLSCRSLSIELGGIVDGEVRVEERTSLPRPAQAETGKLEQDGRRALPPGQEATPPEEGS